LIKYLPANARHKMIINQENWSQSTSNTNVIDEILLFTNNILFKINQLNDHFNQHQHQQ
jgi:hypothetical protein